MILLGALGSVILSVPYLQRIGHNYGEVHALILFATTGMMVLAASASLVSIFVGLETMSICLYVLTGLVREGTRANESALKYFLLGAFSTGFFLYGIALIYGATGTMVLAEMPAAILLTGRTGFLFAGLALLLIGFFFKVSAVPFHMWTPDVYQGAPTTITGFMSTTSKASAFSALILVLSLGMAEQGLADRWTVVIAAVAAVTMVLGNVLALSQTNVKRMLAYSSIAHAGYVLDRPRGGQRRGLQRRALLPPRLHPDEPRRLRRDGRARMGRRAGGRADARLARGRRLPQAHPRRHDGRLHVRASPASRPSPGSSGSTKCSPPPSSPA